jgi:hypothetical protein
MGIPVLFQNTLRHKGLVTSAAVKHLTATVALHMLPVLLPCIEPLQAEPTFVLLLTMLQLNSEDIMEDVTAPPFFFKYVHLFREHPW